MSRTSDLLGLLFPRFPDLTEQKRCPTLWRIAELVSCLDCMNENLMIFVLSHFKISCLTKQQTPKFPSY